MMKFHILIGAFLIGSMLLTSCSDTSENANDATNTAQEIPKSKKGNWTEKDAKKFMNDVNKSMKSFREIFGDEKADAVLKCYLNNAILTFENYEEAESNPDKCKELSTACVKDVLDPEKFYEELAEEAISEEKLKKVADELEKLMEDRFPKE